MSSEESKSSEELLESNRPTKRGSFSKRSIKSPSNNPKYDIGLEPHEKDEERDEKGELLSPKNNKPKMFTTKEEKLEEERQQKSKESLKNYLETSNTVKHDENNSSCGCNKCVIL